MSKLNRNNPHRKPRPRRAVCVVLASAVQVAAFWGPATGGLACDNTVRGQAFVEPRDVHRLCVIAESDDPSSAAILERLERWLAGPGAGLDFELVPLDAGDERIEWEAYGLPSAPPVLPVTVLVGRSNRDNRSFVIDHWEPAPAAEDLAVLESSPAREAIREQTLSHWAVLLYSPGVGAGEDRDAVCKAVVEEWAEKHPPGVAVVRLDRNDPRERTLLSFAGVAPDAPDWAAVCFGRGKLMAPPLVGDEITEANLEELLGKLIEICSCLQPPRLLGVDMPLAWKPELDETAISLVGPGTTATAVLAAAVVGDGTDSPAPGNGILKTVLAAMGLAALLVAGATAAIVRRSRPPSGKRA